MYNTPTRHSPRTAGQDFRQTALSFQARAHDVVSPPRTPAAAPLRLSRRAAASGPALMVMTQGRRASMALACCDAPLVGTSKHSRHTRARHPSRQAVKVLKALFIGLGRDESEVDEVSAGPGPRMLRCLVAGAVWLLLPPPAATLLSLDHGLLVSSIGVEHYCAPSAVWGRMPASSLELCPGPLTPARSPSTSTPPTTRPSWPGTCTPP